MGEKEKMLVRIWAESVLFLPLFVSSSGKYKSYANNDCETSNPRFKS